MPQKKQNCELVQEMHVQEALKIIHFLKSHVVTSHVTNKKKKTHNKHSKEKKNMSTN